MVCKTLLHYSITRELGAGGMGQVYLVEDTELNRQVALKRLRQFHTEVESTAKLIHPNIARIFSLEDADRHGPVSIPGIAHR